VVDSAATITDASYGGIVAIWNLWGLHHDERQHWPTMGHDVRQTGFYVPPPPDQPRSLTAELVDGRVRLQWEELPESRSRGRGGGGRRRPRTGDFPEMESRALVIS
jgi:hypothetical protein